VGGTGAGRVRGTIAEAQPTNAWIAFDIAHLLAPFRKHGRLSVRVERVPQLARFSAGRNNGNNSWSFATDELNELRYLPAEGTEDGHSLTIRVIDLEQGGSTLAVRDFAVAPATKRMAEHHDGDTESNSQAFATGSRAAQRLHDGIETDRRAFDAELAAARAAWQIEVDALLKAASGHAIAALEAARATWQSDESARIAETERNARQRLAEARALWERDAQVIEDSEKSWKAGEQERRDAAERRWQEATAAAEAREAAAVAASEGMERRLRDELAKTSALLSEHDAALTEARVAEVRALDRARSDAEDALAAAEIAWKTDEALRSATAAERQRKEHAAELEALAKRCENAEAALADCKTSKPMPAAEPGDVELVDRLRTESTALAATLAERDTALAQMQVAMAEADQRAQRKSDAALAEAMNAWKAKEAIRLAAAEADWRTQSNAALSEAALRRNAAEAELARQRVAGRETEDDGVIHGLHEELAALQATLADREVALAQARMTIESRGLYGQTHSVADVQRAFDPDKQPKSTHRFVRDSIVVAALTIVVILAYPFVVSRLPASWQWQIAVVTTKLESPFAAAPIQGSPLAARPAVEQPNAVAVRAANVRTAPSATAAVVATLARDQDVMADERRGSWTHVRLTGSSGQQSGWVFTPYLRANVHSGATNLPAGNN
jgi:Bacterial SH3 domain